MLGARIKVNWTWSSRRWYHSSITILGISELKWTGMVNLIQMRIISTPIGKDPLALIVSKRVQNIVLGRTSKMTE